MFSRIKNWFTQLYLNNELLKAVRKDDEVRVNECFQNAANVNTTSITGLTPLIIATEKSNLRMVEYLLRQPNMEHRIKNISLSI